MAACGFFALNVFFMLLHFSHSSLPDACMLASETGPCRASFIRFYYNPKLGICTQFTYGGCQPNGNNFQTIKDCQDFCVEQLEGDGGGEKNNVDQFEKQVSLKNIPAVCTQPVEVGSCRALMYRWYFNPETRNCSLFIYGGCHGNKNNFVSRESCHAVCSPSDHADSTLNNSMSKFLIVHALGVIFAGLAAAIVALLLFMWLRRLDGNRVRSHSIFTVRPQPSPPRSDDTASLIPNMAFWTNWGCSSPTTRHMIYLVGVPSPTQQPFPGFFGGFFNVLLHHCLF